MTLLGGWLLVPAMLGVLCCGWGLLADAALGGRLPGAALPGTGLAAVIVVAGLLTGVVNALAPAATPAIAVGAVGGFVLGAGRFMELARRASPWPVVFGVAAVAVYALPVLVDGGGLIAGYGRLDDSATWLALTDQILHGGRNLGVLPIGTYSRVLKDYLGQGYPVGSFLPVGLGARLTGQDAANAYQPTIAVYGAIASVGLYGVAREIVSRPLLAALAGFVAAQASLLFGYAQWGGVKEVCSATLLCVFAPLASAAFRRDGWAQTGAAVLVLGALLGVLGIDGAPWAGLGALVLLGARLSVRPYAWPWFTALTALAVVASLPMLIAAHDLAATSLTVNHVSAPSEQLGRLLRPLALIQAAGLWPQADFRIAAPQRLAEVAVAAGCLALALYGLWAAVRARAWALPVLGGVVIVGAAVICDRGVPWIDGKALAVVSPVVLIAAAAGAFQLVDGVKVTAAWAAVAALCGATAVSTIAVARDTPSAPRQDFAELRAIGQRFDGRGPLLQLNNAVYSTRHFLRKEDPEGASERRDRYVYLKDGSIAPNYTDVSIDEVRPDQLAPYRLIVRRTGSPGTPPAPFKLALRMKLWEVWARPT